MSNWNENGHRNDGPWWVAPSQSGLGRSISLRTAILIALVVGVIVIQIKIAHAQTVRSSTFVLIRYIRI